MQTTLIFALLISFLFLFYRAHFKKRFSQILTSYSICFSLLATTLFSFIIFTPIFAEAKTSPSTKNITKSNTEKSSNKNIKSTTKKKTTSTKKGNNAKKGNIVKKSNAAKNTNQRAAQNAAALSKAVAESGLPLPVVRALFNAGVPLSSVSALVENADKQLSPIIAFNANRPMAPASTIKLLTTYAGLSLLGPNYKWTTSAYTDGSIFNGNLNGNLYLVGMGDPKLVPERLINLVIQIQQAGIKNINGDLILDKDYFDVSTHNLPPLDGSLNAPYNVGPDPLLYSFKSLSFNVKPMQNGKVMIDVEPPLAQLRVVNNLHANKGQCRTTSTAMPALTNSPDGYLTAYFQGSLPLSCGEQAINLSVLDHTRFTAGGFLAQWQQIGGSFNGNIREDHLPAAAKLIASQESLPLSDIVHDINKYSNNVMARNLFLTIGAVRFKPPATLNSSADVIRKWLSQLRIPNNGLILDNGSGLSRETRISSNTFAAMLQSAFQSPVASVFENSLPIAGLDGTMRHRLTQSPVAGQALIKTGTLSNVRSIAGYVRAASGQTYIVVSFINDVKAVAARQAHDALLQWIYQLPA